MRSGKNLFLLPALIASLGLILTGRATAQTFTNLHNFTNSPDGTDPHAGLILSGNTLYGTAEAGGNSGNGTMFSINTNGTGFTNLYSFTGGSDGAGPSGSLILSGNTLYGTAAYGGSPGDGTVFAVNTNGTGFTNLYSFTALNNDTNTNGDGANPHAGLILSGNTLYGTAFNGGNSGNGTVFKVNTDGTGFTNLYNFTRFTVIPLKSLTNSDGANPNAALVLSGNTLYGTAEAGGNSGNGTVFAINTNGTGFTNLYSFTGGSGGYYPHAGLILSGNTLYGTALEGGSSGSGTVFAINTDGTGFTNLYSFTDGSDGGFPMAGLILSGNTLYGTAGTGGSFIFAGTVFAVNTNGTRFTTLHTFTALSFPTNTNSDGAYSYGGLILSGNTLYGTAEAGGSSGDGTLFSLFIPPQLTIIPSGTNVILTWPTNFTGFTLQSTTNLVPPAVWGTNLPSPIVVSGQRVVTNTISGQRMFYRLMHP